MQLFSDAVTKDVPYVADCVEGEIDIKNGGIKMLFRGRKRAKIYFLTKLIVFLLFVYFVVYASNLRTIATKYPVEIIKVAKTVENNKQLGRYFLDQLKKNGKHTTECTIPRLQNNIVDTKKSHVPICQRVAPVEGSCKVAQSLFFDKPKGTCSHQKQTQVCYVKGNTRKVVCKKAKCRALLLGVRNLETGELSWKEVKSVHKLQTEIETLLQTQHNGYCYIKCEEETEANLNTDYPEFEQEKRDFENIQLLILPPSSENIKKLKNDKSDSNLTNVNFLFIDSLSRHHFFRSLPSTIKLFNEINSKSEAVVLDFELLQAIRSRTFETLNSLLGGYVPQSDWTFGIFDMPPEPLRVEGLFNLFRDAGYSTLWLEDLCFEWEWGISKDLVVHNKSLSTEQTWKNLKKAFKRAGIDSFGMSTANCEILSHNGVNDHFHGPDNVCFNGRHQHEYHLEYLKLYQETMSKLDQPYISFFQTNIAHEDTGLRVQTLDTDLKQYLKFAVKQENTLTILLSDHGNTYGQFLSKSSEGRVEIYHPSMFIIVPKTLVKQFGSHKMSALTLNQHRLVSHLDVHYTVRSLVTNITHIPDVNKQYQVTPRGLFESIPQSRQCNNVPQIPPNLCICEGGQSRIANTSHYVLYAHFAVGTINNAIQSQFRHNHPDTVSGFGRCRRLQLASFQHVRKAVSLNHTTLTMDILLRSNDALHNQDEVFMVSVQSERSTGHMTLNKFERLSPYSKYAVCADTGVQLQLCICDTENKDSPNLMPLSNADITSALLMKGNVAEVDGSDNCLVRINQESEDGFTVSLFNVCTAVQLHILLTVRSENMDLSDPTPRQCYLRPGEIRFLIAGIVADSGSTWDWSYSVKFTMRRWP